MVVKVESKEISEYEKESLLINFLEEKSKGLTYSDITDEETLHKIKDRVHPIVYEQLVKWNRFSSMVSSKKGYVELIRSRRSERPRVKLNILGKPETSYNRDKIYKELDKMVDRAIQFHSENLEKCNSYLDEFLSQTYILERSLEQEDRNGLKNFNVLYKTKRVFYPFKKNKAQYHLELLVADAEIELEFSDEVQLTDEEYENSLLLDKLAIREERNYNWYKDLNSTMLNNIYKRLKLSPYDDVYPIVKDRYSGLTYGNIENSSIVVSVDEIKKAYEKSKIDENPKVFRDEILKNHEDYRPVLKGKYAAMGYNPNEEILSVIEYLHVNLSDKEREVEEVKAPQLIPGDKMEKRIGYKFVHNKQIDGRLIRTIDTSHDSIDHDTVEVYLSALDDSSPNSEKFDRFSYMGLVFEHINKGKTIKKDYVPLSSAISPYSKKWKETESASNTLREKIYRTSLSHNIIQHSFKETGANGKIQISREKELIDWELDMVNFFESLTQEKIISDRNFWQNKIEPIFGWARNERKPAYYKKSFNQEDRITIFEAGIGSYYDLIAEGKEIYNKDKMVSIVKSGFEKLKNKK